MPFGFGIDYVQAVLSAEYGQPSFWFMERPDCHLMERDNVAALDSTLTWNMNITILQQMFMPSLSLFPVFRLLP